VDWHSQIIHFVESKWQLFTDTEELTMQKVKISKPWLALRIMILCADIVILWQNAVGSSLPKASPVLHIGHYRMSTNSFAYLHIHTAKQVICIFLRDRMI
jgi:hypothetical protein